MNQLVNPFLQADAIDEVLLDVAALIELSPRDLPPSSRTTRS